MAIKPKCVDALNRAAKALGHAKPLTEAQLNQIEARLKSTAQRLARSDRQWHGKSSDQRTLAAATAAMEDMRHEAARKVANAQLQIIKTAATEQRIKAQQGLYKGSDRTNALVRDQVNVDNGN